MSTTDQTQAERANAEQIKDEVRRTIRQLAEMAKSESSFDQYCSEVLTRVVSMTGAHGALFWQVTSQGNPKLTHHAGQAPHDQARDVLSQDNDQHNKAIMDVVTNMIPMGIKSESFTGSKIIDSQEGGVNPESFLMLFAPVYTRTKECCGTIELIQRGNISTQAQEGYLRFLSQVATLFQRWHEQQDLALLDSTSGKWNEKMEFVSEVHRSIDIKETAFSIANEARRVLGCDRVSVGKWNGRTCKIIAISSQDRFDNRANVVRKLGNVATASVSADQKFWIIGDTKGIAPEVATKVNDYLDESHSRTLAVIPLAVRPPDRPDLDMAKKRGKEKMRKLGAVVIEYFDADVTEEKIAEDCKLIVEQSQLALENARQHNEIFLQPILKKLGWLQQTLFGDHFAKTMTGLAALGLLTLAMIFVPWELKMKVDGVLQPQVRRHIHAEGNGVVDEIFFEDGQVVTEGQQLLSLRSPDDEMEVQRLNGELTVLRQNINSLSFQSSRTNVDPRESMEVNQQLQMLHEQETTLVETIRLNQEKQANQKIIAPIDGTIVTWNPEQRLTGLVVKPNDIVLSISKLDGPWQLEVKIPQNKVGYIDVARANSDQPLKVQFALGTNPNDTFEGTLERVSLRSHPDDSGVPHFRALVNCDLDKDQIKDLLRPGAGVTAKVYCGKRQLWFICFYQVRDYIWTYLWF